MFAELKSSVEKTLEECKKLFESMQLDNVVNNWYAPDCVTIGSGQENVRGHAETIAFLKKIWTPEAAKDMKMVNEEINGEGQFAFVRGQWTTPRESGRYVTLFKKIDGVYKIYNDVFILDPPKKNDEVKALVEKTFDGIWECFLAKDADKAINTYWAPDCTTIGAEGTIRGIPDTIEHYKKWWLSEGCKDMSITKDEINGEDLYASARGTFKMAAFSGKYVTLFKKIDGVYKIYNDVFILDPPTQHCPTKTKDEVKALVEKTFDGIWECFHAKDADKAINTYWAPDCTTIGAEETIKGIPDTIEYYKKMWMSEVCKEMSITKDEINGEDLYAYARGTFKMATFSGKFVTVFKKIDGVYKIYNDIFTMDVPKKE